MKNFITFSILCFILLSTNAQTAKFTVDKTDTFFCENALITFTNASIPASGSDISEYNFVWHFGKPQSTTITKDSTSSSKTTVRMRFDRPGWHFIRLDMYREKTIVASYTDSLRISQPNSWFSVADTFKFKDMTYRFLSGKTSDKTIIYKYKWYFNKVGSAKKDSVIHSKASQSGIRDLLVQKFDTGKYLMKLVVSDEKGCKSEYSEMFYSNKKLHFPEAFTPNGDGKNDFFDVQTNGRDIYMFEVFNSRGVLVFKSESRGIIWDGYDLNGRKALAGIYYFVVQSVDNPVPVKEVGYVMLLQEK